MDLINFEHNYLQWESEFLNACRGGHMDIVLSMLGKCSFADTDDYNHGLVEACGGGYMDIVLLMIEKGAEYYNSGLRNACSEGQMDMVLLMIEKGARDYNDGLCNACCGGHMDIVLLMIEKGANNYNDGLQYACRGGDSVSNHMDIVLLMIEKGASKYNDGLQSAYIRGRMDIVLLLIEKGANNWCSFRPNEQQLIKLYHLWYCQCKTMNNIFGEYIEQIKQQLSTYIDWRNEILTILNQTVPDSIRDAGTAGAIKDVINHIISLYI